MRTHKLKPYFFEFSANDVFTPDADGLTLLNKGEDPVTITMNETSLVLSAGEGFSIEADNGFIGDEITIVFNGAGTKKLLIIQTVKESIL